MPFLAGYITPQDYGAVGNGTADDTTAIQSALTAAAGKSLYFPAATYKTTAALTVPIGSHINILGDGPSNSVINQTSTTLNALTITDAIGVTIQGIGFTGPSSGSGIGISFVLGSNANTFQCDLRDISVSGFGSHGVSIATPTLCNLVRVVSQNNGGSGFNTTSSAASTTFQDCAANSNTSNGFSINNLSYGNFTGCAATSCGGIGYALTNCNSVSLISSGAQACTGNGFDISGGDTVSLLSCYTLTNNAVGVHFGSSHLQGYIQGYYDNSPGGGATNSIKVDSGCKVTVGSNTTTTATSLDANATSHLDGNTISASGNQGNSSLLANRAAVTNSASVTLATNGTNQWLAAGLVNDSTNDLHIQDSVNSVNSMIFEQHATTSNIQIGPTKSFGSGVGVLGLTNATTAPSTNPSGGLIVYGTSGLVTTRNPQGLVQTHSGLVQAQTSTVTVANTAAATALTSFTVPANDPIAGAVYFLEGYGVYSTTGTPTIQFILYWGGTGGTVLATIPAITTTNNSANAPFRYNAQLTFRSTTTVVGELVLRLVTATASDITSSYLNVPTAATTVTTSGTSALVVGVTWGTANASNTISLLGGQVSRLA
jgi:hypothetical protein